jgi:hypothetical protein
LTPQLPRYQIIEPIDVTEQASQVGVHETVGNDATSEAYVYEQSGFSDMGALQNALPGQDIPHSQCKGATDRC